MTHVPKRQCFSGERCAVGFAGGDRELINRIVCRLLKNAAFSFEKRIRRMREVEIGQPVTGAAAAGFEFAVVTEPGGVVNTERVEVPVRK